MQVWDVTAQYSRLEAWAYDRFTAPSLSDWLVENVLDDILETIPESGSVLDVGCGGGQLPLAVQRTRPDLDVIGLDLSPDLIAWARQRAANRDSSVSFLRGDAIHLPFPSNDFDAVFSVGSIKHWPDQRQGLREGLRVLKPGGNLHVLEADRTVPWDGAWSFTGDLNLPLIMRLPFLPYFKYIVAGNGLSVSSARSLIKECNPETFDVNSLAEKPLVGIHATK